MGLVLALLPPDCLPIPHPSPHFLQAFWTYLSFPFIVFLSQSSKFPQRLHGLLFGNHMSLSPAEARGSPGLQAFPCWG